MKKQHKDEIREISSIASTYAKFTEESIDRDIEGDLIIKNISKLLSGRYGFKVDTMVIPVFNRQDKGVTDIQTQIYAANNPVIIRAFITPDSGGEENSYAVTVMLYINGSYAADLGDYMSNYSTASLEKYLDDLIEKGILKDKDQVIKESIAKDAFDQKKAKQLSKLLFGL